MFIYLHKSIDFFVILLNLSEMFWKKQVFKRKRSPLDKNSKIWKKCKGKNFTVSINLSLLRLHLGTLWMVNVQFLYLQIIDFCFQSSNTHVYIIHAKNFIKIFRIEIYITILIIMLVVFEIQDQCSKVLERLQCQMYCDIVNSIMEYSEVYSQCGDLCSSELEFKVVIQQLVKEGKAVISTEEDSVVSLRQITYNDPLLVQLK